MHDCAQCKPKSTSQHAKWNASARTKTMQLSSGLQQQVELVLFTSWAWAATTNAIRCNSSIHLHVHTILTSEIPLTAALDTHFHPSIIERWAFLQMFWGLWASELFLMSYNCRIRWTVCTRSSASIHRDRVAQLASKQAANKMQLEFVGFYFCAPH